MIRTVWATSIVLLLLGAVDTRAQDGRLQRVRDDARSTSSSTSSADSSKDGDSDSVLGAILGGLFSATDDSGTSIGGALIGLTVLTPFLVPIRLLEDDFSHLNFTPQPYTHGYRGYLILPLDLAKTTYETDTANVLRKSWAVRVSVENGNDFRGINRVNGQLKLEHDSRFGITTNWNYFHENLSSGRTDETLIGDTNLTYRFAQNEIASMYVGLGFRMLSDRRQTDFGFNFTYGGDWFPCRPWIVSTSIDAGNLGSAAVFHARGSIGAIWRGCEIFSGYDFLRIGSTNLQGPMVGLRFWF